MSTVLFVVKKILAFGLCYIVGLFVAEWLVILLHFPFGKNMLVGNTFDAQTISLIIYYGYIVVAAIALLYWKMIEKKSLSQMGLTRHFATYFIGALAGVVLLALCVLVILLSGTISYDGIFKNADIGMILLLCGGFIIQGATEEILCRGIVYHSLKAKTSFAVAMNVSTLMFILPHLMSLLEGEMVFVLIGIINLILISTIFSLLTVRFESIWAACGLHSFWNFVLYAILGLNLSGNEESVTAIFNMKSVGINVWNGGEYGIEASLITAVILALVAAGIWFMNKKRVIK